MVGISLAGATSASAATDADCNAGNTVDAAAAGTAVDIQNLLDASTPVVCVSGTFVLATPLTYGYDLTLHGLSAGVLDGNGATGILVDSGDNTLTVENLRFTDGIASGGSGGGAINGSTVVVHSSQFDRNTAPGNFGGAISATDVEIYDSLFNNNAAFGGGAIASEHSVTISRSNISENHADIFGGAIFSYGVAETIDSTFEENSAELFGGAIVAYGVVTSDSSTFEANSAGFGGAIFSLPIIDEGESASIDIHNSTFVANVVTDPGDEEGPITRGSAIFAGEGSIRQSTFLDNVDLSGTGPASATVTVYEGTLQLRGNIFAGSSVPMQVGAESGGTVVDLGANVFTTASEPALSSVQPTTQFGVTTFEIFAGAVLANNGGPTQTVALHSGSPALSVVPADALSMTVDQRGTARPAVSDAGAYEFDDSDGGTVDGAGLAATGTESAGWLAGMAALLLAAGLSVLGLARRMFRRIV